MKSTISIIIPARNEAKSLSQLLPVLCQDYPEAEIIVVDDGSTDETAQLCAEYSIRHLHHPYSKGNGAAIKSGARLAQGDILVFMDGDGQHNPSDISPLIQKIEAGFDMAVGARDRQSQASLWRMCANGFYNRLASWMVGHQIMDLTSGFRAVRSHHFREFLYLLPNGFSYPTTITMAFFRAGYSTAYVSIKTSNRNGKSHIKPVQDGIRFLLIIFRVGTLYSPLKVFVPMSLTFFFTGLAYYLYTYISEQRFTNMGVLLFITSVIIFLIGLVSEQITNLLYTTSNKD